MYNSDTELLFPPRVIPSLRDLRGESWRALVEKVLCLPPTDRDRLAFVLMMVRVAGCASCNADSYRAMRGCTQCAGQSVTRFRGSDAEIQQLFSEARREVDRFLNG